MIVPLAQRDLPFAVEFRIAAAQVVCPRGGDAGLARRGGDIGSGGQLGKEGLAPVARRSSVSVRRTPMGRALLCHAEILNGRNNSFLLDGGRMRNLGERSEPRRGWKGARCREITPARLRPGRQAAKPAYPSTIKGEEDGSDSVYRDVLYMYLNSVTLSIKNNQIGYTLTGGLPLAAAQHRR